jgi:putative DNA primase/helicase
MTYSSERSANSYDRTEVIFRLYEMGFNLIPANGKKTIVPWKKFQSERVEPDQMSAWVQQQPDNFVLLTGEVGWSDVQHGIVVLDADDEEAIALVEQHAPETLMVQNTGNGGKHFVFRHPGYRVANRTKTTIRDTTYNLDVRGDGGYILCPGSIHPKTGKSYREVAKWTAEILEQCPIYDPQWIASYSGITEDVSSDLDHVDVTSATNMSLNERSDLASQFLDQAGGTQVGSGADNKLTKITMDLLYGFALPVEIVQQLLANWGKRPDQLDENSCHYPWSPEEIDRKIEWCLSQKYRGNVGDKLKRVINPKNHLGIAKRFLKSQFCVGGTMTLAFHGNCWLNWDGKNYAWLDENDIRASLYKWLEDCSVIVKERELSFFPIRSMVSSILDALKAVVSKSSQIQMPTWLSGGPDVIAFNNGLMNVETGSLLPHTPNWFSTHCLPHDFSPVATCPTWIEFLNDVFEEDQERIRALQQWYGYNLINDNSQQKMVMLIGPPRSGKGTTLAMLSALLGEFNVANVSLSEFGGSFGLEPLLGKMAGLIDEGHLGKFSNNSQIVERLKAITGGSKMSVNRKNLPALSSVALPTRFTMAVNEMPRLTDSSAAIRSRLIVIPYFKSYVGNEDFDLVDKLLVEISGITNWALAGLAELQQNGRLVNPEAGKAILNEFEDLASPISAFVNDCCEVAPDKNVLCDDIFVAWKRWTEDHGHQAGSKANFGKQLRSVVPRIQRHRLSNGKRPYEFRGVGLNGDTNSDLNNWKMVT